MTQLPAMILTTDYQQRLALLDRKLRALTDAMDKVSDRFATQVTSELPERWGDIVREFITSHPYVAMTQGREGLARLKAELRGLQAQASAVATESLSGLDMWRDGDTEADDKDSPHKRVDSPSFAPRPDSRRKSRVSGAIGRAESEVLELLQPLLTEDSGPWLAWEQGRLSSHLERMIEAYEHLSLQMQQVDEERKELNRALAGEEARILWETA